LAFSLSRRRVALARWQDDMPSEKRVLITQSNYIPWKGYFDLIESVDEFVLFDSVQYTRRDWRNRNRIKSSRGPIWLSIPVRVKGRFAQTIDETEIADPSWGAEHWQTIVHSYARAPHFATYRPNFEPLYLDASPVRLSEVNHRLLVAICETLGIGTPISLSSQYTLVDGKNERLIEICRQAKATTYLSGPAAREYLDEARFAEAGIAVEWADYSGYPEYDQLYPPFDHYVSVLDLLFNVGPDAPAYMKSVRGASVALKGSR
jgi:hypothetical protein